MKYKYKNRPLRLLKDKNKLPYIKYKNKNISLKGYNIDQIIQIIKKLTKQTKKKKLDFKEQKEKKTQINKFLNDSSKSSMSIIESKKTPIIEGSIKEDTQKINDLKNEIQIFKNKTLSINSSNNNIDNEIKKINKNLKSIEDIKNSKNKFTQLLNYDEETELYSIDFKELGFITGKSQNDIIDGIIEIYKNMVNDKNKLEIEKNKNLEQVLLLNNEKIKLEIDQQELNIKLKAMDRKNKQMTKDKLLLEEKKKNLEKYTNYNENTLDELNNISIMLFGKDRDSTKDFSKIYNDFYNLGNNPKYTTNKKVTKKDLINLIIDKENQNIGEQIEIIEPEQIEPEQQGEGMIKGGLWTNQINKIMKNNKFYIDTIANNELDEILNYIYNNKILKGCFIMNTLNNYDKEVGHWVAIYYDVLNEYVLEYFDPFGENPENKQLIEKFKKLFEKMSIDAYIKVKINQIKQQSITSSNCGWFSIKFLLERLNNISFKDATKYKKISNNEKDITEIKKHYNKYGFI